MNEKKNDKYIIRLDEKIDDEYVISLDDKTSFSDYVLRQIFREIITESKYETTQHEKHKSEEVIKTEPKKKIENKENKESILEKLPIIGKKIKIHKLKEIILESLKNYKRKNIVLVPLMDLIIDIKKSTNVDEKSIRKAIDELIKEKILSKVIEINGFKFIVIPKTIDVTLMQRVISILLRKRKIAIAELVKELNTDPYSLDPIITVLKDSGLIVEKQYPREILLVS